MGDMPFFGSITTGGGGTTNYDALSNKPVINLSGDPIVINQLDTGVYNIEGTWVMTEDDTAKTTLADDLFYVSNTETECKLTWISAGSIATFSVVAGGSASDIESDSVATVDEIMEDMVGTF